MRVLIGGVGYRHLRDHSFGVVLADELMTRSWPPHVSVEDVSFNPIAVVQRLQDDPPEQRFDLVVMVGASPRPGRPPGTLAVYRWDQVLPDPELIHEAITEAVTGIISLDNTLVIARHFTVLPDTVIVVEFEPEAHEGGDEFSPLARAAYARADDLVTRLAYDPAAARHIPPGALHHQRARHSGVVFERVINGTARLH